MKIKERTIWWAIVIVCMLVQLAKVAYPSLASQVIFVRTQLFALATIIATAVAASVIKPPLFGFSDNTRLIVKSGIFKKQKEVSVTAYEAYYRSQKKVAMVFSMLIWTIFAILFSVEKLDDRLFCFLLPISLIGPVLYFRDRIRQQV